MTVTVQDNRNFQAMLREVSYISLELDLKLLAYNLVIMIADGSSNRYLDYLIHCTPELKEYRGSIVFDSPALPVMHSKKKETKVKSK